jgi:hypothetical protein
LCECVTGQLVEVRECVTDQLIVYIMRRPPDVSFASSKIFPFRALYLFFLTLYLSRSLPLFFF